LARFPKVRECAMMLLYMVCSLCRKFWMLNDKRIRGLIEATTKYVNYKDK
jgi:hypothetical protein